MLEEFANKVLWVKISEFTEQVNFEYNRNVRGELKKSVSKL